MVPIVQKCQPPHRAAWIQALYSKLQVCNFTILKRNLDFDLMQGFDEKSNDNLNQSESLKNLVKSRYLNFDLPGFDEKSNDAPETAI